MNWEVVFHCAYTAGIQWINLEAESNSTCYPRFCLVSSQKPAGRGFTEIELYILCEILSFKTDDSTYY